MTNARDIIHLAVIVKNKTKSIGGVFVLSTLYSVRRLFPSDNKYFYVILEVDLRYCATHPKITSDRLGKFDAVYVIYLCYASSFSRGKEKTKTKLLSLNRFVL